MKPSILFRKTFNKKSHFQANKDGHMYLYTQSLQFIHFQLKLKSFYSKNNPN